MITDVISKPVYQILNTITGEPRLEIALPLALKELVSLKLQEATKQRRSFEERYAMDFATFQTTWLDKGEKRNHSYEIENDLWEWEAAVTDEEQYHAMLSKLP